MPSSIRLQQVHACVNGCGRGSKQKPEFCTLQGQQINPYYARFLMQDEQLCADCVLGKNN